MFLWSIIPMVHLPADLRHAVRERFPDREADKRDTEFISGDMSAHTDSSYELLNADRPAIITKEVQRLQLRKGDEAKAILKQATCKNNASSSNVRRPVNILVNHWP